MYEFDDEPRRPSPDVTLTGLGFDPLRVWLAPEHPLAGRTHLQLADLEGLRWVVDGEPPVAQTSTIRYLARHGITPEVMVRSNDTLAVLNLVAADVGVALLPVLQVGADPRLKPSRLTPAPAPRRILLAHRRGSELHAPLQDTLPLIAQYVSGSLLLLAERV